MPDELDHEVIDSPQALFRHLYEAHGVIEALDLDPDTAPLQFWLRRHSDLERATARAAAEERRTSPTAEEKGRAAAPPPPTGPGPGPGPADQAVGGRTMAQPASGSANRAATASGTGRSPSPQPQLRPGPPPDRSARSGRLPWRNRSGEEQAPAEAPPPAAGSGSGPRFRPFADPLVEAVAVALIGRGLDERRVRRGLSTFTGADRRHGEDAVRATYVVPMLDALAAHLAGNSQNRAQWPPPTWTPSRDAAAEQRPRTPDRAGRERTGPPREPAPATPPRNPVPSSQPPREPAASASPPAAAAVDSAIPRPPAGSGRESVRDVAEESLIAQPLGASGTGPAPDADFMAIADVLQERRRSRRGGRREATATRASGAAAARGAGAAPTGRPSRAEAGQASGAAATGSSPACGADDDVMALADAVQRRRASRRQPGRQSGSRARSQP
jgi:hypothetical protein